MNLLTLSVVLEDGVCNVENISTESWLFDYIKETVQEQRFISWEEGIKELEEALDNFGVEDFEAKKELFLSKVKESGKDGKFVTWAVEYDINMTFITLEQLISMV